MLNLSVYIALVIFFNIALSKDIRACDLNRGSAAKTMSAFGAGSHGGERLQSDFLKGLRQAAHVVNTVRPATLYRATSDEAVRSWILANKDILKDAIEKTKIEFNDDASQIFCAMVEDIEPYVVHLSRARCQNISSTPKAGELIIHEAVHMMGIDSETFAPAVAFALYQAWELAGHVIDTKLHSIDVENAPTGRELHTGVWTGEKFVVWGGFTRNGETNTGGIYDHVLDEWTTMNQDKAPRERFAHTAVWTGNRMLVWGGALSVSYGRNRNRYRELYHFNDGGSYDPATNTWEAIPANEALSGRIFHTAVWSGKEMIIWGGARETSSQAYVFLKDGAAYDPKTKTWRKLSTKNAPNARFAHTAIVTDGPKKLMIVWGGQALDQNGQAGLSDQGAIYDIASDTWTPMSVTDAPAPRTNHTMVWTGSNVMIWGGLGYANSKLAPVNTGAIYNPTTNKWLAISRNNAPAARDGHVAVWTGSHMLIFGGKNPVAVEPEESSKISDYQVIALYEPNKGEWSSPIQTDVWMDRRFPVAAWTGHELVVWGGSEQRRSGRTFYP